MQQNHNNHDKFQERIKKVKRLEWVLSGSNYSQITNQVLRNESKSKKK